MKQQQIFSKTISILTIPFVRTFTNNFIVYTLAMLFKFISNLFF